MAILVFPSHPRRVPAVALAAMVVLSVAVPSGSAPSVKDWMDAQMRHLRTVHSREDGSYGSPRATAQVLEALALSPRRYRLDDGPFLRDAADFLESRLREASPQDHPRQHQDRPRHLPEEEARVLLALIAAGGPPADLEVRIRKLSDRQVLDSRDPLRGAFPQTRDAARTEAEDALEALSPTAATLRLLHLAGTRVDPRTFVEASTYLERFTSDSRWRSLVDPTDPSLSPEDKLARLPAVASLLEAAVSAGIPAGAPPVPILLDWSTRFLPSQGGPGGTAAEATAWASLAWALRELRETPDAWAPAILAAWSAGPPRDGPEGSGASEDGPSRQGERPAAAAGDPGALVEAARLEAVIHAQAALSSVPSAVPEDPGDGVAAGGTATPAPPGPPPPPAPTRDAIEKAVARGLAFLAASGEDGRWGFGGQPDAGITALALTAFLEAPPSLAKPYASETRKGLAWIASLARPEGGIHQGQLATYVTSVCVLALRASGDPAYDPILARAQRFLLVLQADESEGYTEQDKFYGGIGYGGDERPDLSNLQFALDALHATGLPEGHEAYRKALLFLTRSQNRSESNPGTRTGPDGRIVVAGNDGGGIYAPGSSAAGAVRLASGKWVARSYGSMTYALLKSYLFAGLDREDERVQAAIGWIRAHFTVEENPGFDTTTDPLAGAQGLYYYYLTMARTLDLLGDETILDAGGRTHVWREELAGALLRRQKPDGSWVNDDSPRWYEGIPLLVTAYALLALEPCVGEQ